MKEHVLLWCINNLTLLKKKEKNIPIIPRQLNLFWKSIICRIVKVVLVVGQNTDYGTDIHRDFSPVSRVSDNIILRVG